MLLAATGLGLIMFNSDAIASVHLRHVCIMSAMVLYIIGFALGMGSIPWAMPFKNIQQNVNIDQHIRLDSFIITYSLAI